MARGLNPATACWTRRSVWQPTQRAISPDATAHRIPHAAHSSKNCQWIDFNVSDPKLRETASWARWPWPSVGTLLLLAGQGDPYGSRRRGPYRRMQPHTASLTQLTAREAVPGYRNRSLRPEFVPIPAARRAAPNLSGKNRIGNALRAAGGAGRSPAGASGHDAHPGALHRATRAAAARRLTPPSRSTSARPATTVHPWTEVSVPMRRKRQRGRGGVPLGPDKLGVCPHAPEATARAGRPEPSTATRSSATRHRLPNAHHPRSLAETRLSPVLARGLTRITASIPPAPPSPDFPLRLRTGSLH